MRRLRLVMAVFVVAGLSTPITPAGATHSAAFNYADFTPDGNDDGMGPHDSNLNVEINCRNGAITNTSVAHREVNNNKTALYVEKHPSTKECWIDNSVFDANAADQWGYTDAPTSGQTWLATVWVKTYDNVTASGAGFNSECKKTSSGNHFGLFRSRLTIHGEDSDGSDHWETNAWRCGGNDTFKRLDLKVTLDSSTPASNGSVDDRRAKAERLRAVFRANSRCCGNKATGKVVLSRFRFARCHERSCSEWGY